MSLLYTPKLFSDQFTASNVEADIFVSFEKDGDPNVAAQTMYQFFAEKNFSSQVVLPYLTTYWRWFVRIVWLYPERIDTSDLPKYWYATLYSAVSLELPYLETYITYLADRVEDKNTLIRVHKDFAQFLLTSAIPLSYSEEKSFSSREVADWMSNNFANKTDIERADIVARIQSYLFTRNTLAIGPVVGSEVNLMSTCLGFLRFILTVPDPTNTVVSFIEKREAQRRVPINEQVEGAVLLNDVLTLLQKPTIPLPLLLSEDSLFSYLDSIDGIRTADGGYDSSVVIKKLEQMAQEQNNPRILDVYYYNESTQSFEWDEALLKELELVPKDFDMSTVSK